MNWLGVWATVEAVLLIPKGKGFLVRTNRILLFIGVSNLISSIF